MSNFDNKRFFSFCVAAATAMSVITYNVSAADEKTVSVSRSGEVYSTQYNDDGASKAVLSLYNDGVLVYSAMADYTDSTYTFEVPDSIENSSARICYVGGNIYDVDIKDSSSVPTQQPTEVPTAAPSTEEPAKTPAPTTAPYPSVYPKQIDAINAFAVVKNVSRTMVDGEDYYALKMLYQGSEIVVNVRSFVTIASSSDAYEDLVGCDASALRDGDVIHFTNDLQGRIMSIEFIYRPDFEDYVNSGIDVGANFSKLISDSGVVANRSDWRIAVYGGSNNADEIYAFGVPVESRKGNLVLADKSGKTMDIYIDSGAMVYNVSNSSRGDKSEFAGTGYSAVTTVHVPDDLYDDEGNIISWDEVDDITYALVRIVDGTATDVAVFIR